MTQGTGSGAREELERRLARLSPEKRALFLAQAGFGPVAERGPTIPRAPRDRDARLSYGQELLWFIERSTPGHAYNVPRTVRLRGVIDRDALQFSVDALVERHEALRTTYHETSDQPVQRVGAPASAKVALVDLTAVPVEIRETEARARMRELSQKPFDLSNDAQLRVTLIRLADDDHVLHLSSHHISSDGWSGNIILRELAALYESKRSGTPASLPTLPVQYADYAEWQRTTLSDDRLESLLSWWRDTLAGAPTQVDLPVDRERPPTTGFEGAVQVRSLEGNVADRVRALAQSLGATPFMVYLSVVYILLNRYTDETELIVGTPIAGRTLPELEGVVGFFANTLLLRASLADDPSFRDLVQRVRTASLGAFDHQEMPLETLLTARDRNNQAIAAAPQVVFLTEDPDRAPFRLPGTESIPFAGSRGATKFELTISAMERADRIRVAAEYRTDLFDATTIDRMLGHYGTLLASAVEAPDAPISALAILSPSEALEAVEQGNDTAAAYPEQATIHGLIEAQADRRPDATAVECTIDGVTESLTYAELDRRANRVAWTLRDAGVVTDERVGVILEKSLDSVVAILGVLKAGAAYLPIDPAYPDDRIAFTVSDAGARVMLTDVANRERLASLGIEARAIDVDRAVENGSSDTRPALVVSPRDLAYVIYTSGSTGRPKGCMIEHRNVTRLLVNDRLQFEFGERDVWTIFHSFAFDFSVWEMFGALIYGGRAVVVPRIVAQSPPDFLALLERTGTTVLNQVPSAFQALMEEALSGNPVLAIRYVIFGGEALKPALLRKWRTRWPETRLINMFGITETTVHVTFKEIGDAEISAGVSNIGRPIPTTTVYLLDRALRPVPVGARGEICVGGLGVARGYLNRPELNAERFVPNPFVSEGSLYRSGDLGRQLPDGEVEYLGRRDHQVKIRGHRIELGEIEAVLLQQADVADAVVLVREDIPGDQQLVAYVVPEPFVELEASALRERMRERLPDIMLPSAIEMLNRLPLTSNGKVDRNALPAPAVAPSSAETYVAPRSTMEHGLVAIFEGLFPGRRIGVRDDFFALGGHSLLAIRLLAKLFAYTGKRVPMATLFENTTVEKLTLVIDRAVFSEEEPPYVILNADAVGQPLVYLHGDGAGGGWYARSIASTMPDVKMIVLPTIRAAEGAPNTIPEMAARHVKNLRQVQPHGPYLIGGFCAGGLVALELAQQLRAAGEVVTMLMVIDTPAGNAPLRKIEPLITLWDRLTPEAKRLDARAARLRRMRYWLRRIGQERRKSFGDQLRWAGTVITRTTRELARGRGTSVISGGVPTTPAVMDEIQREEANLMQGIAGGIGRTTLQHYSRAAVSYIPQPYDGRVVVFLAVPKIGQKRLDPTAGWGQVSREVILHEMESTHVGLVTRELTMFAQRFAEIIRSERC